MSKSYIFESDTELNICGFCYQDQDNHYEHCAYKAGSIKDLEGILAPNSCPLRIVKSEWQKDEEGHYRYIGKQKNDVTMSEQEFRSRLVKFYFVKCLQGEDVDLGLVDGSTDFSIIPRNSKGKIVGLEVGDLRDIINEAVEQAYKRRDKIAGGS